MKTRIFSLSAVLLCLFLLSGCVIVKENLSFDPGGISKAQRIEVAGASDGQLLGTLDTEEDIDAEYQKRAEEFKMDVETLKKYLERNMIREQLLRNKAVAVVVDSAVATEPVEAPVEEAAPAEEKPKKRRTSKKKAEEAPAEEAPAEEAPAGE